jgi:hypothetical protein
VQSEGRALRDDVAAGSCTSREVSEKREKDGEHVWNGEDDREKREMRHPSFQLGENMRMNAETT